MLSLSRLRGCGTLAFVALCSLAFADEKTEPPMLFDVRVGDQAVEVSQSEGGKLSGSFDNADLSVSLRPYRVLSKAGVSFRFPRQFVFEADVADTEAKSWTVEGSDCVVILFSCDNQLTPEDYGLQIVQQFGADSASIVDRDSKMKLGKLTSDGLTIEINIAGLTLTQEAYEVSLPSDRFGLLMLQDSLSDGGEHSSEYTQVKKLLKETFQQVQ